MLPVLNLPVLAFECIQNHLNLRDLIELSFCSKRIRNLIKKLEKPKNSIHFEVQAMKNKATVSLKDEKRGQFEWRWFWKREGIQIYVDHWFQRSLNDKEWTFGVYKDQWITPESTGSMDSCLILMVQYLKDLFQCEIDVLCVYFAQDMDFQKLFVETNDFHRVRRFIRIGGCYLSHWEMTFLLDHLKTQWLDLEGNMDQNPRTRSQVFEYTGPFEYSKPIEYMGFHLKYSFWITEQIFWDIVWKTVTLKFGHSELAKNVPMINKFLREWIEGDNYVVEHVKLFRMWNFGEEWTPDTVFSYQSVLEGITNVAGAKKRAEASQFYDTGARYEDGRDIRRKDGKWATVIAEYDDDEYYHFEFVVWNCPNPNEE